MDIQIIWIIIGAIFIFVGILGCFIPILPGPPLAYVGLLMLQLLDPPAFTTRFLFIWAGITAIVTFLDYVIPVYGTKKFGGSKRGVWGSVIGLIIGIFFFPPFGIIIGPLLGALIGELSAGKTSSTAIRSAFGSFVGFLAGTSIKLIATGWMGYHFVKSLI